MFILWSVSINQHIYSLFLISREQFIAVVKLVMCSVERKLNPAPNDKILDMTKLKALADDKLNVTRMMITLYDRIENTECWLLAFSPFPAVYSQAFFFRVVKIWDCVHLHKRINPAAQSTQANLGQNYLLLAIFLHVQRTRLPHELVVEKIVCYGSIIMVPFITEMQ